MLSDEQLWSVFRDAVNAWLGSPGGSYSPANTAGLRAVEAAVRADCMTIEEHASLCGEMELLEEQLAAAQAVIAEVRRLAELDVRCPCCTGYQAILNATAAVIVSAPSTPEHQCESCEDCLHDGAKCCGCYDGVCCRESGRTPDTRPLYDILKAGRVESAPEQPEGENR